jgi:radical SAM protein with 4Fe4S-binding SPASM domain
MKNVKQYSLKEVCFEITNTCALSCVHCSNFNCSNENETYHSLQKIKTVINELATFGTDVLELSGGEPLEHPDIFNIIRYAKSKGLKTILYTSGVISNSDLGIISLSMAKELQHVGLDSIAFNLQGSIPAIHEAITQSPGTYEKTIRSLVNARSQGLHTAVHFVPMKPNYRDLSNTVRLCNKLKVNEIGILRFVPQGRGCINEKELALSQAETLELIHVITRLRHSPTKNYLSPDIRVGRPQNFCPLLDPSARFEICNAGISKCLIRPNGDVVPCPAFKQDSRYIAGNINDQTLRKIWLGSPTFKPFRNFDYRRLEECSNCPHVSRCQGRCIAQRVIATGSMFRADPCCPISQTLLVCAKSFHSSQKCNI